MNNMEKIACFAFSEKGFALAQRLADALGGTADRSGRPLSLADWTAEHFPAADALVYVGACGIAVRAIALFVRDKAEDPAVVVIDERALHVIPVLSGHLGGANDLARRIARLTGSDPVITTATDVNGVFAVDEWSKRQNCRLLEKEKIVKLSAALLAGKTVRVESRWPVAGDPPEGVCLIPCGENGQDKADIVLDIRERGGDALHLIPEICVLGAGCRRGTPAEALEEQFSRFIANTGIACEAIRAVATIDLKKDEPGLRVFAERHGWPLMVFSAEQLAQADGDFTASEFVSSVTGVDNVCERSAVLASEGSLISRKYAGGGVTFALAEADYEPDWEWEES